MESSTLLWNCCQTEEKGVWSLALLVWHMLESPGREFSLRNCLHWVGLWVCLWKIVLIKQIDVGRSSPLRAPSFPRQEVLNCLRMEKLSWVKASEHACVSLCSWLCVESLPWLPTVMGWKLKLQAEINPLLLHIAFSQDDFITAVEIKLE